MNRAVSGYLCCHLTPGFRPLKARWVTRSPSLDAGEIAIKVNISVPESLFKRPSLEAHIRIPDDAVAGPTINAEVIDNIQEAISQQLGVDLKIALVEPGEPAA